MNTQAAGEDLPIFSERLSSLLEEMLQGRAPNAGHFCGHCYTPIGKERESCYNCGRSVAECPPRRRLPREVIQMFRRMRRRESVAVNGFALAGLALAVAVFVTLFALFEPLWWRILDMVLLVVMARGFAGILGGLVGDSIGYRYARRRLGEEWRAFQDSEPAGAPLSPTGADESNGLR